MGANIFACVGAFEPMFTIEDHRFIVVTVDSDLSKIPLVILLEKSLDIIFILKHLTNKELSYSIGGLVAMLGGPTLASILCKKMSEIDRERNKQK